jgi:hypothetical protein
VEDLNRVMLLESHRAEVEREMQRARLGDALPSRPFAWRAWLIMAILLIGIIAWWIH